MFYPVCIARQRVNVSRRYSGGAGSRSIWQPRDIHDTFQSRKELSRIAGLPLRRLIALERGLAGDMPVTEFLRISYALKMKPDELTERFEEIEKNIAQGVIHRE